MTSGTLVSSRYLPLLLLPCCNELVVGVIPETTSPCTISPASWVLKLLVSIDYCPRPVETLLRFASTWVHTRQESYVCFLFYL